MKNLFFLLLSILAFSSLAQAQLCDSRELSSFVAGSSSYSISGSAVLEKNVDGSIELKFNSDFSASSGPNLYVFLAIQNAAPTVTGNTSYEVAALSSNSGSQTYSIPSSVDFDAFNYVLVHCKQFNAFWGGGALASGSAGCSSTTSTMTAETADTWNVYPNPAKKQLNIELKEAGNLFLYNQLGQLVFSKTSSQNFEQIELSNFPAGLYILQYESNGKQLQKRIIIE